MKNADSAKFDRENSIRKTLAQSAAGIIVISGVLISVRTFGLSRQGQLTDRYFNAIEKLGAYRTDLAPLLELRLGAIYALERLALDSPRDQWFIMEILTAYVRHNAPLNQGQSGSSDKLGLDIQAVITAIGRRKATPRREGPRSRFYLSLKGTRLCRANLASAELRGVDLEGADLKGASLWGAQMQLAALMEADLTGADMRNADLTGAFFRGTNLEGADIQNACLDRPIDVTLDQIRSAKNWELAHYSKDLRSSLGLPPRR